MRLFSEIYGLYYRAVEAILAEAVRGGMTRQRMAEIARERAFMESDMVIPTAMTDEWGLLDAEMRPVVRSVPTMPMSTLELRWQRSIADDPRIRLFDPPADHLDDVEPLFPCGAVIWSDRYADGDPYQDEGYIARFRITLTAIRERRLLEVETPDRSGGTKRRTVAPTQLEWSPKDDKFRLLARDRDKGYTFNMARIASVCMLEPYDEREWPERERERRKVVFELVDERNALERVMLHFSDLEKMTERIGGDRYRVSLTYEREDEIEIVIRLMSFGPMLRVIDPPEMIALIRERITKQYAMREDR